MGLAVMKPVRTGFLAILPPAMREALRSTGSCEAGYVEWALDYLWDIPEVSVAVSGMELDGGRRSQPAVRVESEAEHAHAG